MDVSNASGYDGTTVAADACLIAQARDGALEGRRHRGDEPAGTPGREDVRARLRPRRRRGSAPWRRDGSRRARGRVAGRRSGDLPAAELLRRARACARPRGGRERRRRARDRARRPDVARRARGARRVRLRDRDRRGPGHGQLPGLRRPALRLPRRAERVHPAHARPHHRRDDRPRRRARLCADAADPRAAHPPREGDLQHHDEPDAARAAGARHALVAGPAGNPRRGGDLHEPRRVRAGAARARSSCLPIGRRSRSLRSASDGAPAT